MKIVVIPSGFKECLDACEVAAAMERGAKAFDPSIDMEVIPMIDGGEGFAKRITEVKGGKIFNHKATGPLGQTVTSHFGMYREDGKVFAVIEMAAVAGLSLVPPTSRNPLLTTTKGVGELMIEAINQGATDVLIGCGDSGTSDGGAGMGQALGVKFYDKDERLLNIQGAKDLMRVAKIDVSETDPRLEHVNINVACNWTNVLCGEKGVARVFGPQKGASPKHVEELSDALEHLASLIQHTKGINVRSTPGGGASGGLGAGLVAFAGAKLHSRFDIIKKYINIEKAISTADVILTAEGSLDFQTPNGKIPAEVARIAKKYQVPVIALTGTIGKGAKQNYTIGIDAYFSIIQKPISLEHAIQKAPEWIAESTEMVLRQVSIGLNIAKNKRKAPYHENAYRKT
ncbi:glycerate kinase [Jeotgalibacillus proteolyticus]|uniref:Glycerate kinase n=1 Tax=Jeotgalibacillus proteolyticus TaxID=2082395 RepID=A0A2S5G8V6_9BACL|nr:glycerate kinase [Jeotgalibacillus proteolyticus]PPA69426.1 glycerate kinase [Jeotgalibacillus proteolyticus]